MGVADEDAEVSGRVVLCHQQFYYNVAVSFFNSSLLRSGETTNQRHTRRLSTHVEKTRMCKFAEVEVVRCTSIEAHVDRGAAMGTLCRGLIRNRGGHVRMLL